MSHFKFEAAQALRSLVELGSIELYGRMMRMPYWSCLGADMTNPEVKAEVDDWWEALAADMPALMKWLQRQMKARGLYEGAVDGVATSQLLRAVQAYQMAMGLDQDADLDIRFFRAYLAADHQKLEEPAKQLLAKMPKPLPVVAKVERPKVAALRVQDKRGVRSAYDKGEPLEVEVTVLKAGHLYCYMVGQSGVPDQFFPNSTQRSTFVTENARLLFPGKLPFRLVANRQGGSDTVACVISQRSLGTLPLSSGTSMSARSAKDLESIFMRLTGEAVSVGSFEVQSR